MALITISCLLISCDTSKNKGSEFDFSKEATVISENELNSSVFSEQESNNNSILNFDDNKKDLLGKKINNYFSEYLFSNEYLTFKTALMYGISSEGALVRGYYHHNDLKLIKVKSYGELGRVFWNFYLIDNETIFVIADEQEYSTGLALEEPEDIYVKKECTKAYVILQGKEYEYDSNKMDIADESDASLKELFDEVVSFLDSSDFVDEPTRW